VHVLDEQHGRSLGAERAEHLDRARKDEGQVRVAGRAARRGRGVESLAQGRQPRGDGVGSLRALGCQPPEQVAEQAVWDAVIELVGAAGDRVQAGVLRARQHLGGETRLVDPRVAAHEQACGIGRAGSGDPFQLVEREGELLLASDELRGLLQV
jgi:hypothetical protein